MWLMARVIKSMGIKWFVRRRRMSYLRVFVFHKAPNAQEFHEENVRKLGKLHMYDCFVPTKV
jgi:asparagine synthase (glutamine-hydrolysing)